MNGDRFKGNRALTEWEHSSEGWRFTVHLRPQVDADTLAHELAHIVARVHHGIDVSVHGDEWQKIRDQFVNVLSGAVPRMTEALENLAGDVYLFSMGEITREQLLRTQTEGLDALKEVMPL